MANAPKETSHGGHEAHVGHAAHHGNHGHGAHVGHQDAGKTNEGQVKDPVCGMAVDPHETTHRAQH